MKRLLVALLFLCLYLPAVTGPAAAQFILPEPPIIIPRDVKIAYQRVNVTIDNQVATTHIDQLFVNENEWMLEGVYLFPLPAGAAVSQLTMWVDGQPIEAKILDRDEARQIYDEIVRQWRDPALLEYVGGSAIQANVFPIPPRDERRIEITYSQLLTADAGLLRYVYPQSSSLYTNLPLASQSIRVELRSNQALRAIYSPSHAVAVSRDGDFRAVAGYEGSQVTADTDFELYYTVAAEEIGLNLLSYKEAGADGFFLLLVAPGVQAEEVAAKDVILVVDVSGSMRGEKMRQAQDAARYVLDNLNPEDRFNVVAFSTGTRAYARELAPAGQAAAARQFVNSLDAVGGTNISQALLEAIYQADSARPTTLIFLTDGLATEGITDTPRLLDAVQQAAPPNVRLFVFGVGDDVDTTLLDGLAQNHRGAAIYVRPLQAIDEIVSGFYAKISAPVLTDLRLDFGDIVVEQLYPTTPPDLFAGSQLVLAGRYRQGGPATITLTGMVNGRTQTFTYADNGFRSQGGDPFIPRLWATRAIGHLLTQIRLHGEDPELVQSVVNLSVRYGVITPYTSFLIEEDDIFSQTARDLIVEEVMVERAAAPLSVSGAQAVDAAADMAGLAAAEVAAPLPATAADQGGAAAQETVRLAGSKTFVLRDGVWLDTAYDPERYPLQPILFASDAYFGLVTAVPESGQYLALGAQVIFVHEGTAYQIVTDAEGAAVTLPVAATSAQPAIAPPAPETAVAPIQAGGRSWLWPAVLGAVLLVGLGFWRQRRRQQPS